MKNETNYFLLKLDKLLTKCSSDICLRYSEESQYI